ncbi:YjbH domain-containing protein [Castellaniella sp.]|uniref:YjbH domain-containing protein n=1 Tax=Castellaniella sp. TaxID=1955812 RepID=UPI00355E5B6B
MSAGRLIFRRSRTGACLWGLAALCLALGLVLHEPARADAPTTMGLTGLLNMPSGRMAPDGTLFLGYSHNKPYDTGYAVLQAMPWLQLSGRYTSIRGTQALSADYGTLKDKSAGIKLRLMPEGGLGQAWMPEIAIGYEDVHGTQLFKSQFVAATKRLNFPGVGQVDATLGYGRQRIDGLFGGARFKLDALPSWALVAEYDATRYQRDPSAAITGLDGRRTGQWGVGLEYTLGPLTLQASRQGDRNAFNAYFTFPLDARYWTAKTAESGPFAGGAWASAAARPSARMWAEDRSYRQNLLSALHAEGLREVRLAWRDGVLAISASSSRYQSPSRGVGRVVRLALAYAPWETRELQVTWTDRGVAGLTWSFFDIPVLERYLAGTASRSALQNAVTVSYADPRGISAAARANDLDATLDALALERGGGLQQNFSLGRWAVETPGRTSFEIGPSFRAIVNDPSGAFKYDAGIYAQANLNLTHGFWFTGGVRQSIWENVSDIRQESNSTLHHVRSDLAKYRQASRFKVEQLLINKLWQPAPRVYLRASTGLYEEMFGGVGGQALYLTPGGRWAFDLSVDWVRQRNYKGTGFMSYSTVTALAAAHYRLPWFDGVTATVRAGRFLAGDVGARFEIQRRFKSGIQVGLWYTRTNGDDITSPGSPGHPYYDKGVFMRIPLGTMASADTSANAFFSLSPWNRDVGQMVQSPMDLYDFVHNGWLYDATDGDGLRGFADLPQEDTP